MASEESQAYREIAARYFDNAQEVALRGEWQKVSELVWGYVSLEVKALAAGRGISIGTHRQLVEFTRELAKAQGQSWIKDEFSALNLLHVNFYEDVLDEMEVREMTKRALDYVDKLRKLSLPGDQA
ncbi:MAG: hypothetical protein IRZ26_07190 [Clostridia bacterium]|nr:hypothetical protein [Clostridia bacterium]